MASKDRRVVDSPISADMASDDAARSMTLEEAMPPTDVPQVGLFRGITITLACTLAMVNNVSNT
jgi:hypothetical protein